MNTQTKKCTACAELINIEAKKCKHCGEVIDPSFTSSGTSSISPAQRKVGVLLGFGIWFIPYIFSWFTLRKGYSKTARIVAFIWLAIASFVAFGGFSDKKKPVIETPISTQTTSQSTQASSKRDYWEHGNYVDDFGDKTKKKFIKNAVPISGLFSNSATNNSLLKVQLLINSPKDINIMLYEYAGNNPVKAYSRTNYTVIVKDSEGKKHTLLAENYSDRLSFGPASSQKINKLLMKGDALSFVIFESSNTITNYSFSIENSPDYKDFISYLVIK